MRQLPCAPSAASCPMNCLVTPPSTWNRPIKERSKHKGGRGARVFPHCCILQQLSPVVLVPPLHSTLPPPLGTGLRKPVATARAFPGAKGEMSPYIVEPPRLQNSPAVPAQGNVDNIWLPVFSNRKALAQSSALDSQFMLVPWAPPLGSVLGFQAVTCIIPCKGNSGGCPSCWGVDPFFLCAVLQLCHNTGLRCLAITYVSSPNFWVAKLCAWSCAAMHLTDKQIQMNMASPSLCDLAESMNTKKRKKEKTNNCPVIFLVFTVVSGCLCSKPSFLPTSQR